MQTRYSCTSIITGTLLYAFYRLVDLKIRRDEHQQNVNKNKHSETYILTWGKGAAHYGYQHYPTDHSVGHMAVQFDQYYVSFWPKGTNKVSLNSLLLGTNEAQLSTLNKDIQVERKEPDSILVINGLDHALMLAALFQLNKDIQTNKVKFQVLHNHPWQDPENNTKHHCATTVNKILHAGGFPCQRRMFAPWSTTPGFLGYFYQGIGAREVTNVQEKKRLIQEMRIKTRNGSL